MKKIILLLVLVCTSISVLAEDIERLNVRYEEGVYFVSITYTVNATLESVRKVLTDYSNLHMLDPAIYEIQILKEPCEDSERVKTLIHECFLFFCKDIVRTEDIYEDEQGNLVAKIVEKMSDMKSGESRWEFQELDGKVEINFSSRMEPDFWVPPLIGPGILKESLLQHLKLTARNLEKRAN